VLVWSFERVRTSFSVSKLYMKTVFRSKKIVRTKHYSVHLVLRKGQNKFFCFKASYESCTSVQKKSYAPNITVFVWSFERVRTSFSVSDFHMKAVLSFKKIVRTKHYSVHLVLRKSQNKFFCFKASYESCTSVQKNRTHQTLQCSSGPSKGSEHVLLFQTFI